MIHRIACCCLMLSLLLHGCAPPAPAPGHSLAGVAPAPGSVAQPSASPGPALTSIRQEPTLRVRVAARQSQVRIDGPGPIQIRSTPGRSNPQQLTPPVTLQRQADGWLIRDARGRSLGWTAAGLMLKGANGQPLTLGAPGTRYPGQLVFVPDAGSSRFHVVNHVTLERYLPGVVYRELYPGWHAQAFAAQAIAARSYALWEMSLNRDRAWDLESTTASQAYVGQTDHAKANHAAAVTRGQVIAYQGHIVPAFYSSTIGQTAQDAVVAFPGRIANIAPLVGGSRGTWDQSSPHARWTMTRSKRDLALRLAAWGRAHRHPIARLLGVQRINVSRKTRSGQRPAALIITDTQRQFYELPAETFRQAVNYTSPSLPTLPKGQRLKSSHVSIQIHPTTITFLGQGFGHGVGMSQFGAQAMAKAGHRAEAILRFYYPHATIQKIY